MPPPPRTKAADYHFHTYDYARSHAWVAQATGQAAQQLYSMVKDLTGLLATGRAKRLPNIALHKSGPVDDDGRQILTLSFGDPTKPAVMITGGIHAREWIAPELAYLVAEYLVLNYPSTGSGHTRYQTAIRKLVENRWIHITPMLNPSGNWYTAFSPDAGARLWRKNRRPLPTTGNAWQTALAPSSVPDGPFKNVIVANGTCQYQSPAYAPSVQQPPPNPTYRTWVLPNNETGVDLNRNFDTLAWGYDGNPTRTSNTGVPVPDAAPGAETYFGPRRTSEIETGYTQQYAAQIPGGPRTAIDYHAYGEFILYPTEAYDTGRVTRAYIALGERLGKLITGFTLGSPSALLHYDATGSLSDHQAEQYRARAFVIELDPWGELGPVGFRLDETKICGVFEENIRGALALIAAAGAWTMPEIRAATRQFATWDVDERGNQLPVPLT